MNLRHAESTSPLLRLSLVRWSGPTNPATVLATDAAKDDEEFAGLVTGETADEIELQLPAGIHRTSPKPKSPNAKARIDPHA